MYDLNISLDVMGQMEYNNISIAALTNDVYYFSVLVLYTIVLYPLFVFCVLLKKIVIFKLNMIIAHYYLNAHSLQKRFLYTLFLI